MNVYTGIGSRETPKEILSIFEYIGLWLASKGYILRSGHAAGADSAFECGCDAAGGCKEIYLPWKGFNGSDSKLILRDNDDAISIAMHYHPAFDRLSNGAKKLQARNAYQIFGYNLDTPSDFVVCWTKGGKGSGGTGQAIRIAKDNSIPVFDFGRYDNNEIAIHKFSQFVKSL